MVRSVVVGIVGHIGLLGYERNRLGVISIPKLILPRAFSLGYQKRKYAGMPSSVPTWFVDAGHFFDLPTREEQSIFQQPPLLGKTFEKTNPQEKTVVDTSPKVTTSQADKA